MNIEELNKQIKSNEALLVYFSGEHCGVCHVLKPKIGEAFTKNYPKIKQIEIQIEDNLEVARQFNVFSMPTILNTCRDLIKIKVKQVCFTSLVGHLGLV